MQPSLISEFLKRLVVGPGLITKATKAADAIVTSGFILCGGEPVAKPVLTFFKRLPKRLSHRIAYAFFSTESRQMIYLCMLTSLSCKKLSAIITEQAGAKLASYFCQCHWVRRF